MQIFAYLYDCSFDSYNPVDIYATPNFLNLLSPWNWLNYSTVNPYEIPIKSQISNLKFMIDEVILRSFNSRCLHRKRPQQTWSGWAYHAMYVLMHR
jgi:hypothetical protein